MYFLKCFFIPFFDENDKLKNGDTFLWKDEIHQFHSDAGYGIKTYTNYNKIDNSSVLVNWSNFKSKVKVFICTNDIKIGDTYYVDSYDDIGRVSHWTTWDQDGILQDIESHNLHCNKVYRKVGEVDVSKLHNAKDNDVVDEDLIEGLIIK